MRDVIQISDDEQPLPTSSEEAPRIQRGKVVVQKFDPDYFHRNMLPDMKPLSSSQSSGRNSEPLQGIRQSPHLAKEAGEQIMATDKIARVVSRYGQQYQVDWFPRNDGKKPSATYLSQDKVTGQGGIHKLLDYFEQTSLIPKSRSLFNVNIQRYMLFPDT